MEKYQSNYEEWDDQYYGTGPTEPPKSRGGLLAGLLILIIFLSGIITVLGILNIRLFQELQVQEQGEELSISFHTEATEPDAVLENTPMVLAETQPQAEGPFASMDLHQSPQGVENMPVEGGVSLQDIYTQNIPSVVSISVHRNGNVMSTGTGVVLSQDGYIVTNSHVVESGLPVRVQLTDDTVHEAQIVGRDEVSDLAVLYVDSQSLIPAKFGDSSQLRVGDTVVAIGDPLGVEFRGTYTNGIVSAINRDVDVDGRTMTLIQTNAALNSGNSGGPLINCYGQVVGINTMKIGAFTDDAGVEGLGFAIPSVTVKEIVDQLIAQGYVSGRPTLGIEGDSLASFYQHYYRMPAGVYITYVDPASDAYAKGLQDGDILLQVNGTRVTSMEELKAIILECAVGDTVETVIYRSGQQYLVELTLMEDKG